MFGVLSYFEDGMTFEYFKDYESALVHFENVRCMGYRAVMFDYDMETHKFLEFYE